EPGGRALPLGRHPVDRPRLPQRALGPRPLSRGARREQLRRPFESPWRTWRLLMSDRPFRVLGVQQIAVGGLDKTALRRFWVDTLGLEPVGNFRSESENVDEDIVVAGSGPLRVEVDLMQPIDPEKKPKVHDPMLNHVGLWIDDLKAAV